MEQLNLNRSVDPRDYPNVKCDKCGCEVFVPAMIIKKIPGLVIGKAGEDINHPLSVFVCHKCGTIMAADRKTLKLDNDETVIELQ